MTKNRITRGQIYQEDKFSIFFNKEIKKGYCLFLNYILKSKSFKGKKNLIL